MTDLTSRAPGGGRPRKIDGRPQTEESFVKLLEKRAAVYPYIRGLWALLQTRSGTEVLVNSSEDDDTHVRARFTLAPDLVGFLGFRRGEGNVIADCFFKPWHKDAQERLERISGPLERITALRIEAEAHRVAHTALTPQDLIRLLITHSAELPWHEFSLLLDNGRKVTAQDEDLSPGLLNAHPALGFIGLMLFGGRLFRFSWPVVEAKKRLKKALADAEAELRDLRPQPVELMTHLAIDTVALLLGPRQ